MYTGAETFEDPVVGVLSYLGRKKIDSGLLGVRKSLDLYLNWLP